MSTGPIRQIQILRASAGERSYSGHYGFSDLPRLQSCVAGNEVEVEAELKLTRDHRGQRLAQVQITVSLPLQCQRCMEAVTWQSEVSNELLLLTGDAPQSDSEDRESILLEDGVLNVAELVEDEIMLALPLAPRHADDSDCGKAWNEQLGRQEKPAGPFAALAALKTK